MKLLFSVPTGYHVRELIMPLRPYLEADTDISHVDVLTPVADGAAEVFHGYGTKFAFHNNPSDLEGHKKLIQELAPDIVITDTVGHDELDYPILRAASELGMKTLTFIASWDNVWKIKRLMDSGKPVHIADIIIVWNTMMRDHFLRLFPNISTDRVYVIGAPRLDYFWQKDAIPSKQEVYSYLGISDTTKPLIHVATTELYPIDYVVKTIRESIDAGTLPDAHIYASVHPGGNMENHKALADLGAIVKFSFGRHEDAPHPNFKYRPTENDIKMLIGVFMHTNVLVNHSSSVALESMIAHVPIMNVAYGMKFDWWRWYRSPVYRDFKEHYADIINQGATYVVKNRGALIMAMQDALQYPSKKNDNMDATLKTMITTVDGTASKKVLNRIKASTI